MATGQGRSACRVPGQAFIGEAPWHVVDANDKKAARLNIISHLLEIVPYQAVPHEAVELPPRRQRSYSRPPLDSQSWVPQRFVVR